MFDLEKHLQEHAHYFKKYTDITKKDLHFNFSFLDLQFLEKDTNHTLEEFIKALHKPAEYSVKNGFRKNKKGYKQKYTTRKINLLDDIKIEAIHLTGPSGEDTMPHIHLIGKKNARWGKNYSLLKRHISEITKQFNLLANFDTPTDYNPQAIKKLSKAVNKITWRWKQCNREQFKKSIENKALHKELNLLDVYTLQTRNLSYYIKSMNQLQSKFNRYKSNFTWNGHNLKDTYPIPLIKEDLAVIDLIKNKKFQQKDIAPYINHPILRDFIRYSENLTEPFILNAIKKQTNLLNGIRKNRTATRSYMTFIKNIPIIRKSDLITETNSTDIIKKDILQALKAALTSATNTNSLISLMDNAGYSDFQFIKTKQKVTGCLYKESKNKFTIKLNDIGMSWEKIQGLLKNNLFKLEIGKDLSKQSIDKQISLSNYIQHIKPHPLPPIEPINYNIQKIKRKKEKATSNAKEKRENEKRYQRGISELTSKIQELERNIGDASTRIQVLPRIRTELEQCETDIAKSRTQATKLESNIEETNSGIQHLPRIRKRQSKLKGDHNGLKREKREIENGDYEKSLRDKLKHEIESVERKIESNKKGKLAQQRKNELLQSNPFLNEDNNVQIDEFKSPKVK